MKSKLQAISVLLLTIIVSMQLVNAFHFHEPQLVLNDVACDMCAHHMHHSGHFNGDQYHMHPCLSCEISSNSFIEPLITHLASVKQCVIKIESYFINALPVVASIHWSSRAPPTI